MCKLKSIYPLLVRSGTYQQHEPSIFFPIAIVNKRPNECQLVVFYEAVTFPEEPDSVSSVGLHHPCGRLINPSSPRQVSFYRRASTHVWPPSLTYAIPTTKLNRFRFMMTSIYTKAWSLVSISKGLCSIRLLVWPWITYHSSIDKVYSKP